jgi:hypothetical protein
MSKERIKPNFYVVRIDETGYWDMSRLPGVKKVWGCYLVDKSRLTYCCCITPSYWLQWIAYDEEFEDYVEPDSKEWNEADWEVSQVVGEDGYYDCKYIDKAGAKIEVKPVLWGEVDWFEGEDYDYTTEEGYDAMLQEAYDSIREDGCYW